jgi:metal-responsive CopG/Arc/MetJ family transcriptional regulator
MATILSISVPPELAREAERTAKMKGRTKNDLVREALRRYLLEEKVQRSQANGARRARKLGIKSTDVERLIQEHRAGLSAL